MQIERQPEFFTVRGASQDFFNGTVSAESVRDWVQSGKLRGYRPGGRVLLVKRVDLERLVNESAGVTPSWLRRRAKLVAEPA
jgi:excisionase family DNA binding protein